MIALGHMAPRVFKEIQFPVSDKQRLCGAYAGCVVNNYGKDMDHTVPHHDVEEPPITYSCMSCCGDFNKGGLILYDLKIIVEMNPGDVILFPDSILLHANEAVIGERRSVVCYTSTSLYDWWHREFNYPKEAFTKKKTKRKRNK